MRKGPEKRQPALKDFARLQRSERRSIPIDFEKLFSKRATSLERLTRRGWSVPKIDTNVRILIKVRSEDALSVGSSISKRLYGSSIEPKKGSVASGSRLRPVGGIQRDGTRWFVIELPLSLGYLLGAINYDRDAVARIAADLIGDGKILAAEVDLPRENLVRPLQEFLPGCTAGREAAPTDVDWAPRLVRFFDLPANSPDGSGVRIGQIDTGYTDHPELDLAEAYDLPSCTSVIDNFGGVDQMPGGTSHGTATASVITSRPGTTGTNDLGQASPGVTGIANGATIVSVRTVDTVVVIETPVMFDSAIAEAVWHCISVDCHVITMSIGGFVGNIVKEALVEAHDRNLILCAAAGNCVGFVVEPASLPQVIGCGSVGIDAATGAVHPWPGTSEGPQVDISAPGENVWIADWIDGSARIRPGEGTSFASPHIAAGAALWLERHGREALINIYDFAGIKLCDVFKEVVRNSATVPTSWDTANNGAGILNVVDLVNAPLPEGVPQMSVPQELIDLIPTLAEPVHAVVDIDHIVVRDDGEFWGWSEPYLLCTFFQIDGDTARIEAEIDASAILDGQVSFTVQMRPADGRESIVSITKTGGHGSMDSVNIGPLELNEDGPKTVSIDSDVGHYRREITPIPIRLLVDTGDVIVGVDLDGLPGFIGAHVMLSEQDFTPSDAIDAAHTAVADGIRSILEDVLAEIELSDLSVDPNQFVERMAEIEDAAKQAAADEMNLWEAFWGGVVDPDDQLIQHFVIKNVLELSSPAPIAPPRYHGDHGDWILSGEVRLD